MISVSELLKHNKSKKGVFIAKEYSLIAGQNLNRRMVLAQIFYWNSDDVKNRCRLKIFREGHFWLAKSISELAEECDMNKRTVETALKYLSDKKIIIKKQMLFNNRNILHIRLNREEINKLLNPSLHNLEYAKNVDSSLHVCVDSYKTENTSEITDFTKVKSIILSKDKITIPCPDKQDLKEDVAINWYCSSKSDYDVIGDCQKILKAWNVNAKGYKYMSGSRTIRSTVTVYRAKGKRKESGILYNYILRKLETMTPDKIIDTILNYFKVLKSTDCHYKYQCKNLAVFLESDTFENFLSKNKPLTKYKNYRKNPNPFLDKLDEVRFIAHDINRKKAWDRDKGTYMTVQMDICQNRDVDIYWNDIKHAIKYNIMSENEFVWIEECIIALIYRKKDMYLLEEFINIHDQYRRIVYKNNEEFFNNYIKRDK